MILVTGCSGFIGSHVCEFLLNNGELVIGLDDMNNHIYDSKHKEINVEILKQFANFTFIKGDICDTDVISTHKPHKIIHLASVAGVRKSIETPDLYEKVNVGGFIHILEEARKNNVKHIVYASSSSVYGSRLSSQTNPFCETDQITCCNSPYACSKLSMELYAKTYFHLYNLSTIGLRFFTVYGPRGRPDMAPYKFLDSIMNERQIEKFGDGKTSRDYTYISDIVDGIIAALEINKNVCEIYNLGNSNPVSLNEFIKLCENVTNKTAIVKNKEIQPGDVPHTYANIEKAQRDLGYSPRISLYTGLTNLYLDLKKD